MTPDNATTPSQESTIHPLVLWWQAATFEGKEFCTLKETGELLLKATPHQPERVIATITAETAEPAIKALVEKYPEVKAKVQELEEEWSKAADKIKLLSKVGRTKDYLLNTNAIGDFESLSDAIIRKEKELQVLLDEHYEARLKLVQQVEEQAKTSEDWKETTQVFKDYTEQWKHVGFVDKGRNDELWNRLEKAKNLFFDRKRQHHEDQEKEMLQNLDLKLEIIEKAEQIKDSEDWKEATDVFKQLMDSWKEVGHTMRDKNEALWERLIAAKNHFFERKKQHFEVIHKEQQTNLEQKLALLEKAESIKDSQQWVKATQQYADIMEAWKQIGKVPIEHADDIWNRFKAAKDHFFNAKRQHHEKQKVTFADNYAQKLALVNRALQIKNSLQWRTVTDEMNELMDEWKKIGPVAREHSNKLWNDFIGARKYFFERKDADRDKRKQFIEQQEKKKVEHKKAFLHKLDEELQEEIEKLADFKVAIENITPGNKEAELRAHLTSLIAQTEQRITQKRKKLEESNASAAKDETPSTAADKPQQS